MCYFYKLAAAIAVAVGAAHPAAMSHLNLNFSEDKVALSLNVQELTLREITSFKLDTNGDGNISQIEFEDGWAQVDALLRSSLWFEVNGELVYADFTPSEYLGHEGEITNIVLDAEFSIENPNDDFVVHSELFLIEGNPKHKTFISASGFGAENLHYV
ncbi:MAG: hypothetical protein QGF46_06740, partial [Planctomycetota bacterium]|nr:hypothetical protein [Planctomycetota bacterium]